MIATLTKIKSIYLYVSIFIFSFIVRVISYNSLPKDFGMDEVFYVPQSLSIIKYGYEKPLVDDYSQKGWAEVVSESFFNGTLNFADDSWLSSHPPFGKMLIAVGMLLFGETNTLGWKISAILAGSVTVILSMLIAQKIFSNKLVTTLTGVFIAIDPMAIAMSRTSHLDIFLTLMVSAGIYFTVRYLEKPSYSNAFLISMFFALASSIKWSGVYFYFAIGLVIVFNMVYKKYLYRWKDILLSISVYLTVYLLTWSLWIANYALPKTGNILSSIALLIQEHVSSIQSHTKASYAHPYKTNAWEWFLSSRPAVLQGEWVNGKQDIIAVVSTPNLVLWISSIAALVLVAIIALRMRKDDKNINNVFVLYVAVAAGWLPWFFIGERTIFQYYTVVFQPYLYIILAFLIKWAITNKSYLSPLYRISSLMIVIFSLVISVLMYSSAVGIRVHYDGSGYEFTSKWQTLMLETGLYDKRQMSDE